MSELKQCPFCGHDVQTHEKRKGIEELICEGCAASVCVSWINKDLDLDRTEVLRKKWNKRNSGWIPVSERLPEKSTDNVLVYFDNSECAVAQFEKSPFGNDEWYYACEYCAEITHWMPIELPK